MKKLIILLVTFLPTSIWAAPVITSYSDWSINSTTLSSAAANAQKVEDDHSSYLNPGFGGQAYDAEALYATWDSDYLYIGLMTGRAPGASGWSPGDFAIDLGSNASYEYGVVTSSLAGTGGGGIGSPGEIFDVSQWNYGIWSGSNQHVGLNHPGAIAYNHPTSVAQGTKTGDAAAFSYTGIGSGLGNWGGDQHYFVSAAIDHSLLGAASMEELLNDGLSIHWAANCNNDFVMLDIPAQVPEPSVLALMMFGLAGFGLMRRKV